MARPASRSRRRRGEAKLQVKRRFLLDAVVSQGAAVLQLRPRENEPLLLRGDP